MASNRSDLEVRVTGRDDLSPELNKIESKLIRFVGAVGAGIAAIRITTAPIRAAIDLERELANVRKTANFSAAEINSLSNALLNMSTKVDVSALDLAKIAAAAGQQGLGKEGVAGIVQFTDSVARMSSVLGITAEVAAEDIGKIINIFKIPLREIEKAVSTFNEVSNNSTAKGSELLDVVKRIGDAAGSLNLADSVALAATGLDLGQSPEVVGTAFAKMFASMSQKATEFGRLLNIKTSEWIPQLQRDGVGSFKKVLASLRTLNAVDQQNTIIKLFGGGRIGSLVNKLVQDTTDSVLTKNLKSAVKGDLGTSALQEQATVLNTFKAQGTLTLNALTKAGIDATNQLLPPLTKYAIQLREVIQSPGFNSFLNALAAGLGNVGDVIARTASMIASWNVNWENLLPVLTAFLGLSLEKALVGIAASALGLSGALKSISTSGADAAKALKLTETTAAGAAAGVAASGAASKAAKAAELLGYKELYDAIQKNKAAKLESQRVSQEIAAKQTALTVANRAAQAASDKVRDSFTGLATRGDAVSRQKKAVDTAVANAAAAELAIQAQKQARIVAAEQAHQARVVAIEQEYQTRRTAILATGSQAGLRAVQAERRQQQAAEEATHARSLRGIESYWSRRIAITAASAKTAVDAERLAYMRALNTFDAAVALNQKKQGGLANASAGVTTAATDLAAVQRAAQTAGLANPALTLQASLLGAASTAWAGLGLAIRTVGTVLATVASGLLRLAGIAFSAFAWVTVIYSIADAFGLIDKAMPVLGRFTDWLGLTSEAQRKLNIQKEVTIKRAEEEKARIDELTKAYRAATAASGGLIDKQDTAALITTATISDSRQARVDAVKTITDQASGALVVLDEQSKLLQTGIQDQIDKVSAAVIKGRANIANLQYRLAAELAKSTGKTDESATIQARYTREIQAATYAYAANSNELDRLQKALPGVSAEARTAETNFRLLSGATAELFTPESINLVKQYLIPLSEAGEKAKKLEDIFRSAQEADRKIGLKDPSQSSKDALKNLQDANQQVAALKESFVIIVAGLAALPGLPEAVKKSVNDTLAFMQMGTRDLKTIVALSERAGDAALTGAKAGFNKQGPATGDRSFDPKAKEALARRLAKAEFELTKAKNEAQLTLVEEGNKQELAADEDRYARGLSSLATFFSQREALELANTEAEIKRRRLDLVGKKQEAAAPGIDVADKKRIEAEVATLNGQIAVLEERKVGIRAATSRDIKTAAEAFNLSVLAETNKLADIGIIPSDVQSRFTSTLDQMLEEARVKLAKLRVDGKGAVASGIEKSIAADAVLAAIKPNAEILAQNLTLLEQSKTKLSQLQKDGLLTASEAEAQLNSAIDATLPKLKEMVVAQERGLALMAETGLVGTPAYNNLALAIASTKGQLVSLGQEAGNTARTINEGITTSLANSLTGIRFTMRGVLDAATGLLKSIASQIEQVFAKNAAESIMRGLGSTGTGGIGGFFSGLLGATGKKNDGSSPDNPLYVSYGTSGALPGLDKVADGTASSALSLATLPSKIGGFFGTLGSTFSGLFTSIISFLGTAFATLISTLWATATASAAGDSVNGLALLANFATVAHTGGTVGQAGMVQRLVSPAMFANATRYHTGGMAGLKPGEVPIIAQKGETIRTVQQERSLQSQLGNGAPGAAGGGIVNVWVVSPDQQPPSMGPNDVVVVVTDNIARGGSIKKMIQQVQIGR